MECRKKREHEPALPKDYEVGEKEKNRKNKILLTGEIFVS
jgi:hypothetical protein